MAELTPEQHRRADLIARAIGAQFRIRAPIVSLVKVSARATVGEWVLVIAEFPSPFKHSVSFTLDKSLHWCRNWDVPEPRLNGDLAYKAMKLLQALSREHIAQHEIRELELALQIREG